MRAAIYARCSTGHQDTAYQISACEEVIAQRGWTVSGTYIDAAVSGTKESREAFDQMLSACRCGEVQAVVAVASDRISRSLRHLLNVERELQDLGVGLLLLRGQCDTTTPGGRLMFSVFGAFAEFERNTIAARIRQALAEKKKAGVNIGRPRTYSATDADILALKRSAPALSIRDIAARLGASRSTVQHALKAAATF